MIAPDLAAEAPFLSSLQRSWEPTRQAVNAAIEAMVLLHGSDGCAALLAQEYGEHPGLTQDRMSWCVAVAGAAFVPAPA